MGSVGLGLQHGSYGQNTHFDSALLPDFSRGSLLNDFMSPVY